MGVVDLARDTHWAARSPSTCCRPTRSRTPLASSASCRRPRPQAAGSARHRQVFDIRSDAGVDFIAMEYVKGRTLDEVHAIEPGLQRPHRPALAVAIVDAVAAAHRPASCTATSSRRTDGHRRVRAESPTSASRRSRRRTGDADGYGRRTGRDRRGHAPYMSPEQAEGRSRGAFGHLRVGAVLYEMVTGTRPFIADCRCPNLHRWSRGPPPPRAGWSPWCPPTSNWPFFVASARIGPGAFQRWPT